MSDIELQEQLVIHDPDNGVYGDCFRATIATLLGLRTEQVPHFLHDNCEVSVFNKRVGDYLAQFGLVFMQFNAWDLPTWKSNSGIGVDIYHDIADDSPRFSGTGHSAVGKNGSVFHDPHPTKMGLPVVTDNRTFGFLVQSSPNIKDRKIADLLAELSATKEKLALSERENAELCKKLETIAHAMHYPAHWDDAAYPTLVSAITEAFACAVCADPIAHGYDSISHPYHLKP